MKTNFGIIMLACVTLLVSSVSAETVQLDASKDNTLYFSQSGSLSNGRGESLFVGATKNGMARRGVISFDIAGSIPVGSTINSVQLTLNMTRTISGANTISLKRLLADWGEGASNAGGQEGAGTTAMTGDATWVHRFSTTSLWSAMGGDFTSTTSASTAVSAVGVYSWGSTPQMVADVQSWLDTPATNFGWILMGSESPSSAKRFASRENGTSSARPVLTIDYTPSASVNKMYYPHVASTDVWETEIAVVNTGDGTVSGMLVPYTDAGQKTSTAMSVSLGSRERMEVVVGNVFSGPGNIGYIIFESNSSDVVGYTKFFIEGRYRSAVPAVTEINSGDVYISHIASTAQWWTGLTLTNTTANMKTLVIEFNNGEMKTITLMPGEHAAYTIRSLFNGVAQTAVTAGVIKDAEGVIGLELFGSMDASGQTYLSGILLRDSTATTMFYPHVASDATWWTGIVAYNPLSTATDITITSYMNDGTQLSTQSLSIDGKDKFVGTVDGLDFPAGTAWFRIDASASITGFELFGTHDGKQLAGYTGVNISDTDGIFAKKDIDGWTGIAFVNSEASTANISLTAYDDDGNIVAAETIVMSGFEKRVALAESLFTSDISNATYIVYSADKKIVGFQINGSSDNTMLDALPGLR